MGDRNEILTQFLDVTGSSEERARFYLEAADWQLQSALASYYEEGTDPESLEGEGEATAPEELAEVRSSPAAQASKLPAQASKNTAKPKPQTASSRIRTLANLSQGNANSSDEDEGQAFYAGGSDSSGQQILGPGKKKKDIVADMFKSVQEHGAEVVDPGDGGREQRPSSSFQGTGYRLGQSSDDSQGSSQRKARPVNVVLKLWREGFSVNDGALRRYSDSENKEFLESIRRGEVPLELIQELKGSEIQLQMEDHRHEDPAPVKPKVKAFSGKGNMLGSPAPGSESPAAPSLDEKAKQALEEAARSAVQVDPGQPQTSIQVRLADGSCLLARLNYSHTVADLRRFITTARPQYENATFSLLTTFPRKELTDDSESVEKAGLLNAAVLQRLWVIGDTGGTSMRPLVAPATTDGDAKEPSSEPVQVKENHREHENQRDKEGKMAQQAVVSQLSLSKKTSATTAFEEYYANRSYKETCEERSEKSSRKDIPADDAPPHSKSEPSRNSLKSGGSASDKVDILTVDNISFINKERPPTARVIFDAAPSSICRTDSSDGMIVLSGSKTISSHANQVQAVKTGRRSQVEIDFSTTASPVDGKKKEMQVGENQSLTAANVGHSSDSATSCSSYLSHCLSFKDVSSDSKSQDKTSSSDRQRKEAAHQPESSQTRLRNITISIPIKRWYYKRTSCRKIHAVESRDFITLKMPLWDGRAMPSILVRRKGAESERKIKIIFPNRGTVTICNNETNGKSELVTVNSAEAQFVPLPEARKMQNASTDRRSSDASLARGDEDSMPNKICNKSTDVALNVTWNSTGVLLKNAPTLRLNSRDVQSRTQLFKPKEKEPSSANSSKLKSLKTLINSDALTYRSPFVENVACAFSEKYLKSNTIYETLRSFSSDVDGTFHETTTPNLCDTDRIFCCQKSSSYEILTTLEPLVTSPTDIFGDYPVSFVGDSSPRLCSRKRETLDRVFRSSPNQSCCCSHGNRAKSPAPSRSHGDEKMRRAQNRLERRPEPVEHRAPKNKRPTLLSVARRDTPIPPRRALRGSKQHLQKRSATAIGNHRTSERDYQRVVSSGNKRRLKTTPEKL